MDELHAEPAPSITPAPTHAGVDAEELSTLALMREVTSKAVELMHKELELARSELKQDVRAELGTLWGLGAAAVLGIVSLTLVLVAACFALAQQMPAWSAALLLAGGTAAIALLAGVLGWHRRVRQPLAITRRTLEEDVEWARERIR